MKETTKRLRGLLYLLAVIMAVVFFTPTVTKVADAATKTVSITFKNNGGSGNIPNRTYTLGKTYGSLPAGPTPPKGMSFAGWYTKVTGGKKINPGTIVSASYTKLYAHYEYRSYLVKFDTQGGVDLSSAWRGHYYTYSKAYGDLPPTEKAGYVFLGWYTQPTGGKRISPNTTMLTAANHTLYAHWQKVKYRVYDDDSVDAYITSGNTYTLPSVPHCPSWIWELTYEDTGTVCLCNPGQKIRVTSNIKLRAIPYYVPINYVKR